MYSHSVEGLPVLAVKTTSSCRVKGATGESVGNDNH